MNSALAFVNTGLVTVEKDSYGEGTQSMNLAIALLITMSSTAKADFTDEQMEKASRAVKVYRKGEPPAACEELKEITSPAISVIDEVGHEKILRRMAVKEGANALMVIGKKDPSLVATLYKCKEKK